MYEGLCCENTFRDDVVVPPGPAGGGERSVRGTDGPGKDREEDHAARADVVTVRALLGSSARRHSLPCEIPVFSYMFYSFYFS